MRKPVVAEAYKLGKNAKGLSELVSMTAELSDCIHKTDTKRLDVLPSGVVPPNHLNYLLQIVSNWSLKNLKSITITSSLIARLL